MSAEYFGGYPLVPVGDGVWMLYVETAQDRERLGF